MLLGSCLVVRHSQATDWRWLYILVCLWPSQVTTVLPSWLLVENPFRVKCADLEETLWLPDKTLYYSQAALGRLGHSYNTTLHWLPGHRSSRWTLGRCPRWAGSALQTLPNQHVLCTALTMGKESSSAHSRQQMNNPTCWLELLARLKLLAKVVGGGQ